MLSSDWAEDLARFFFQAGTLSSEADVSGFLKTSVFSLLCALNEGVFFTPPLCQAGLSGLFSASLLNLLNVLLGSLPALFCSQGFLERAGDVLTEFP